MIKDECAYNFKTFLRAAKNGDIALVSTKDAKGRDIQTLCIVAQTLDDDYVYMPFGIMISPSLYPLINKLQPPSTLKGEWIWDDD
jgi:hypothetical protein